MIYLLWMKHNLLLFLLIFNYNTQLVPKLEEDQIKSLAGSSSGWVS